MFSIEKQVNKTRSKYFSSSSTKFQDMMDLMERMLLVIMILAFSGLICLTSPLSKQYSSKNVMNSPARFSRGYQYIGSPLDNTYPTIYRQDLTIPPLQVRTSHNCSVWCRFIACNNIIVTYFHVFSFLDRFDSGKSQRRTQR